MTEELIAILLVDDDEEDYLIMRDILEDINHQSYTLDWVSSYDQGLAVMQERGHDVYLIDYRLGIHDGLELIKEGIGMGCESPMILLTGQGDIEIDRLALKVGASDYIVKGQLDPMHLERSIRYSIKEAENLRQIRKLNQELEKRVEARTEALNLAIHKLEQTNHDLQSEILERQKVEEALRKSQEELEEALKQEKDLNELKSRFVSMASHEFRTPLSTILSSISLIEKYQDNSQMEKRLKHVRRIKSSVNNLTNILNDFLSVDKLETGKIYSSPVHMQLPPFVHQLVEDIKPQLKKGQKITYQHEGEQEVWLDDKILTNVLLNLLSNAIKYSPQESPIELITRVSEEDVIVEVKDHGIGIPHNEQKHLFERFFRAHNATNIQGTGLGLNIVKKYVKLMNGTIAFQSEENRGSTFTVIFPRESHTSYA